MTSHHEQATEAGLAEVSTEASRWQYKYNPQEIVFIFQTSGKKYFSLLDGLWFSSLPALAHQASCLVGIGVLYRGRGRGGKAAGA